MLFYSIINILYYVYIHIIVNIIITKFFIYLLLIIYVSYILY